MDDSLLSAEESGNTEDFMTKKRSLQGFPVAFFSIVMGLTGVVLSLQWLERLLGKPQIISSYLLFGVMVLFFFISITYARKVIKYFPDVLAEINHPVSLSFFSAITVSMLLISIALLSVNETASKWFWLVGTVSHFIVTLVILSIWIQQDKFEIKHYHPGWFIPIVGTILVPVAGVHHFSVEISWFFFSIGIFFWLPMFAIFLYRVVFHPPLPQKILPTFFILIPPPAIGFVSYINLTNGMDNFARLLYDFALFMTIFLFTQIKLFYKIKFSLSWWAYTFPIAAISVATGMMYLLTDVLLYKIIFIGLFCLLLVVVLIVSVYTIKAMKKGDICNNSLQGQE